jgi:hypothetical protein
MKILKFDQDMEKIRSRRRSVSFVEDSSSVHPVSMKRRNSVGGYLSCKNPNSENENTIDNNHCNLVSQGASISLSDSGAQLCMDQLFVLAHNWTQAQAGKESTTFSDPVRVVHCELPVPPPSVFQRKCRRSAPAAKD